MEMEESLDGSYKAFPVKRIADLAMNEQLFSYRSIVKLHRLSTPRLPLTARCPDRVRGAPSPEERTGALDHAYEQRRRHRDRDMGVDAMPLIACRKPGAPAPTPMSWPKTGRG